MMKLVKYFLSLLNALFKSEIHIFLDKIEETSKLLEKSISESERTIDNMKASLAKQIALGKFFKEKESTFSHRIDSLSKLAEQLLVINDEAAARECIRERIKEQNKLQELHATMALHSANTHKYQQKLKRAIYELDDMIVKKEALLIKHNIVRNEIEMNKNFGGINTKLLLEKIQNEILATEVLNTESDSSNNDHYEMIEEVDHELALLKHQLINVAEK